MCVQYILGLFSGFGDTTSTSVHQDILVNTMSTLGDIMSISGGYYEFILDVQYIRVFNINFRKLLSISSLRAVFT